MKKYQLFCICCFIASLKLSPALAGDDNASIVFSSITFHRQNVFDLNDPAQQNFLFILANNIHITTKERFMRKQLLFKEGDRFNPYVIDESERLLRDFDFLRNARMRINDHTDTKKSLDVYTRDAWSTIPELSYGTEGGEETWSIGIKEKNLLGLGKTAAAYYKKDLDRTYKEFYYEDPAFFYPRWKLGFNYQHDGGRRSNFEYMARPFYSSVSPWSWFAFNEDSELPIKLYADGDEFANYERNRREVQLGGGVSIGSTLSNLNRVRMSYFKRKDDFLLESPVSSAPALEAKQMTAVKLSYEYKKLDYYKQQYVNTFDRIEDFNRGNELFIEYGYAPKRWDSDRTRHLAALTEQKGLTFFGHNGLFAAVSGETRVEYGKAVNFLSFYHLYHYIKIRQHQTLVSSLNFEHGINIDPEEQILLGGATGLRGYSIKQFSGNKKLLFNMELRSFWIHDFLKLVSIGGILFFDSGFNWHEGRSVDLSNLRSDVGFGLRLDPTRGRGSNPFNISLAYALNKNDRNHRWVVTISGQPDLLNTIGRPGSTASASSIRF
ncbi:MAG: BamA/TamA family outer membrane protein [bacterium]